MEESIENINSSKYNRSSILSKIYFTWIFEDLFKGYKGKLKEDDVNVPNILNADCIGQRLSRRWGKEVDEGRPSLFRVLFKEFGYRVSVVSLISFVKYCAANLIQIYCLGVLVDSFDETNADNFLFPRYLSALVIILVSVMAIPLQGHCYFISEVTGMKISAGCSSLVFQKILRISTVKMSRMNVGHLINIIANDVSKLDYMCRDTLQVVFNPFLIVAFVAFLNLEVGVAVWAPVAVIFIFLFVNMLLGRLFKKIKKHKMMVSDQRVKFTSEMVSEVKAVKMLSWEDAYFKTINEFRKQEFKYLIKTSVLRTFAAVQNLVSPHVILFVLLVVMVLIGDEITPRKVFISVASIASLRMVLVVVMGRVFEQVAYGLVIFGRIKNLLLIEEDIKPKTDEITSNNNMITLNFESCWYLSNATVDNSQHILLKINTIIPRKSLTVIAGSVGSGKSSFLLSMANELHMLCGDVSLGGTIAFLPQQPWLFPTTIRQNILFGSPFDQIRYHKVIWACAIDQDLASFEKGDETIVDDKGLTLSGGQKARICLARCLYRDCDIYLLDDPLSAVDVKVENHIYKNCFLDFLADKTIILVSHRLRNLNDKVNFIRMEKGEIVKQGLFGELKSTAELNDENMKAEENVDFIPDQVFDAHFTANASFNTLKTVLSDDAVDKHKDKKRNPFLMYFQMAINCCGGFAAILLLICLGTFAQVCCSFFDISLTMWTNEMYEDESFMVSTNRSSSEDLYYLGNVILAEIALFSIAYGTLFFLCLRACRDLHRNMLKRVLRAEMTFFNINKTGEIINKFTKDLENLDDILPLLLSESLRCLCVCFGLMVNVAYSNYIVIGPVLIAIVTSVLIIKIYSRAIKIIRHIEADARSPMYTFLNTTIHGLAVIRSHEIQTRVSQEFNWHQDRHSAAWFLMKALVDGIALLADTITTILIISVIAIIFASTLVVNGSKIGLAISSMLLLGDMLQRGINQVIEAQIQIVSVSRIQRYAELQVEDESIFTENRTPSLPPSWPQKGALVFKDVSLYYGSVAVLKSVSFSVNPGEKIGIVGRTGAGKSSIVTALFRMASITGSITIDDVDILSLPLYEYRKKLSVIPQNPVILAGSIRYNLDPSNELSDEQLWSVLESVCLKGCIEKLGDGLNTKMDHLSVGEKQLCCLARVILRNSKIVILDEATSNVDNRIDHELQSIIKQRFKEATMFIIAHRLETIMDTDRVMVLHNGQVLEFDKPSTLLHNPNSVFKRMVNQTSSRT